MPGRLSFFLLSYLLALRGLTFARAEGICILRGEEVSARRARLLDERADAIAVSAQNLGVEWTNVHLPTLLHSKNNTIDTLQQDLANSTAALVDIVDGCNATFVSASSNLTDSLLSLNATVIEAEQLVHNASSVDLTSIISNLHEIQDRAATILDGVEVWATNIENSTRVFNATYFAQLEELTTDVHNLSASVTELSAQSDEKFANLGGRDLHYRADFTGYNCTLLESHLGVSLPDACMYCTNTTAWVTCEDMAGTVLPLDYCIGNGTLDSSEVRHLSLISISETQKEMAHEGAVACCHDDSGVFSCKCVPGFVGDACNECDAGYYGNYCVACPTSVVGSACSGHGICDDGLSGNGTCNCSGGYSSVACTPLSDYNIVANLSLKEASSDNDYFGEGTNVMSNDGKILAIGALRRNAGAVSDAGSIVVFYSPSGALTGYQLQQELFCPAGNMSQARFGGEGLAMTSDGGMIAASNGKYGELFFFFWDEAELRYGEQAWATVNVTSELGQGSVYLTSVSMSADGSYIAVGIALHSHNGIPNVGSVVVFVCSICDATSARSYELTQVLLPQPPIVTESYFGMLGKVSMSGDGLVLALGSAGNTTVEHVGIFKRMLLSSNHSDGHSANFTCEQVIRSPIQTIDESHSFSVVDLSFDGSVLVIGAPGVNANNGTAFVYAAPSQSDNYTLVSTLSSEGVSPDLGAADKFGLIVAVSQNGNLVVVSSPVEDVDGVDNAGASYFYVRDLSSGSYSFTSRIRMNPPQEIAQLGRTISMDEYGHIVAVSASREHSYAIRGGAVFIVEGQ